ncbi:MAG: DUF4214 domain-containing protein [Reyranella sp.]
MAWYTGKVFRGVDYAATWPGWNPKANAQFNDSDMANDAFASFWAKEYQAATQPSLSVPANNGSNYRDDLGTIAKDGFNLVRLYDWDMARGTSASSDTGLDHINFLDYAKTLGIKVVVPVSNYFLSNDPFSWNNANPTADYAFSSAPDAIQKDFKQFIASITDPTTGKIHEAVMISVANEPDYLTGPLAGGENQGHVFGPTNASDALARMNWWVHNLHQQINGSGTGPDGDPVVNGSTGAIVPIGTTFGNGDQTGQNGSWFKALLSGAQAGQGLPSTWLGATTFSAPVTGLAQVDPNFASYYFNSFNIGQSNTTPPYIPGIANTLKLLDEGASPWPGETFTVPMLLMEVFTPNRDKYSSDAEQAKAALQEVKAIEEYLATHNAGTSRSTTNLIGYNYFSFQDEPAIQKQVGLYQYDTAISVDAHTGTTSVFYGGFGDFVFPVYKLVPTVGPDGAGTLVGAWTANFPHALQAHNDAYVVTQGSALATAAPLGVLGNDQSESPAAIALQSGVENGQLGLGLDGAITYTPDAGFSGIDTFSYFGFGDYGSSDIGQVTIHVVPVNVGPTTTTLNLLALTADEQIAATYVAFFGRAADAEGLDFWVDEFNDNLPTQGPAAVFANIAQSFGASVEATALYPFLADPVGASDAEIGAFLNSVYANLFDRSSDSAGLAYWTGQIQQTLQAGQSVGSVLIDIISGAQDTAAAKDITTLMSKVAVSLAYVAEQEFHGIVWAGASDIAAATALLQDVTADPLSVLVGIANAEALITNHA